MRKFIITTSHTTIGNSTINFDRIAKEKIYKSINDARLAKIPFIREKYRNLKYKLNRIPTLTDFYEYDELDPMFIIGYMKGKISSYPELLTKLDKNVDLKLSKKELLYIKFLTQKLANGKRPNELVIIKELMESSQTSMEILENIYSLNQTGIKHALNVLDMSFYKNKEQEEYEQIEFFENEE